MYVLLHYLHALPVSQKQDAANQVQGCLTPSSNLNQMRKETLELKCAYHTTLAKPPCTAVLWGNRKPLFPSADDAPRQRKHLQLLWLALSILNQILSLCITHPLCAALGSAVSGGLRQNFSFVKKTFSISPI